MEQTKLNNLKSIAAKIRLGALEGVHAAASGHPGGSLSIADIMAYLYFEEMNVKADDPKWADRDRLVLSKGHTAPALYAILAEQGFFPREELVTLRRADSHLQGHPSLGHIPGVDMTTGSLGQGLSAAVGMAIAAAVLVLLICLLRVCRKGSVFTPVSGRLVLAIALLVIAEGGVFALLGLVYRPALAITVVAVTMGLCFTVVSQVLREAAALKEENDGTI